ncbi:MFS transporter [Amycolatopsis taiwanensis]|uniref:MFS transporter n=1 Tax=Amycolatopsis taiwanensis TaxID=342230 RepID=UPI001B80DB09|nr:MFS transporter [Amycolatopsis taiwanensis]
MEATTEKTETTGNTRARSRTAVLLTMCAGMFLVQLDVTVVNIALPTIGRDLGASLPALQWIVDGYTVVLAALLLAGGAIGDVLGHRSVVACGFALFGLASAGCALAPASAALIGFRVLQGLGAALLLPGTLAVITATFPQRREQARALGVWAGLSALALSAGPLLGGLLVAVNGWRLVFAVNVPLVVVAMVVALRVIPDSGRVPGRRVDIAGAALAAVALAAIVYGVIDASVIAFVVAVPALVAFVLVERRAADPMLPLSLLRSRQFVGANLIAGAMNFVGLGMILVNTLYLQSVLGYSPLEAALRLLPGFVPLAVLAPVTGRLAGRFGPRPVMIAGLAAGALAMLNLLRIGPTTGYPTFLPGWLGLGIGMGLLTAAVVAAAVGGVPAGRGGVASGINNTARQAFGAIGIALFGAIAGQPGEAAAFVSSLHVLGLAGAGLWLAAIGLTVFSVRRTGK